MSVNNKTDRIISLSSFEELSTPILSDTMDELGIACALPGIGPQRFDQPTVAGYAMTAQFVLSEGDESAYRFGGGVGRPLEKVLQQMARGDMVVMDLGGTQTASSWGGLASRLASMKGVRGTIVNGTCRDVAEIRGIGYPIWAVGAFPRRSRNDFAFGSVREEIVIGCVPICPGDIMVADASGVVCVPRARANEVLKLATEIQGTERKLLSQIEQDNVVNWDEV